VSAAAAPVPVPAARVRPLRAAVLRLGQAPERLVYAGDNALDTLHLAVIDDGAVIGIATVMADPHPRDPRVGDWRIRGMATEPRHRRAGLGRALLDGCETHARERGGCRLWCNARLPARSFYERAGFLAEGEAFELEGIGAHLIMSKQLA
jgi:GNAT superfamily N-acetyltransferase